MILIDRVPEQVKVALGLWYGALVTRVWYKLMTIRDIEQSQGANNVGIPLARVAQHWTWPSRSWRLPSWPSAKPESHAEASARASSRSRPPPPRRAPTGCYRAPAVGSAWATASAGKQLVSTGCGCRRGTGGFVHLDCVAANAAVVQQHKGKWGWTRRGNAQRPRRCTMRHWKRVFGPEHELMTAAHLCGNLHNQGRHTKVERLARTQLTAWRRLHAPTTRSRYRLLPT